MIHLLQMIKLKLRSNIWGIKLFPLVDFSELTDTFVLVLTIKVHFDQFNRKEDFLFNVILLKLMCHVLRIFRFLNWKTRSKHCRRSSFSAVWSEGTVKHLFSIFSIVCNWDWHCSLQSTPYIYLLGLKKSLTFCFIKPAETLIFHK